MSKFDDSIRVSAGQLSMLDITSDQPVRLVDADEHFKDSSVIKTKSGSIFDKGRSIKRPAMQSLREYVEAAKDPQALFDGLKTNDINKVFKDLMELDHIGPNISALICIALQNKMPNIGAVMAAQNHEELFRAYNDRVPEGRPDSVSTLIPKDKAEAVAYRMAKSAVENCKYKECPSVAELTEMTLKNTTEFRGFLGDTPIMKAECEFYYTMTSRTVDSMPTMSGDNLDAFEDIANFLDHEQKEQMDKFLDSRLKGMAMDGAPGTGKSHVITAFYNYYMKCGSCPLIMAYTNKACVNLQERIPDYSFEPLGLTRIPTINSAAYRLRARRDERPLRDTKLIIIDESSIVSSESLIQVMDILSECHGDCRLLMVGDRNQLPPVCAYGTPYLNILRRFDRDIARMESLPENLKDTVVAPSYLKLSNYKRSNGMMYDGFCKLRKSGTHQIDASNCISLATVSDIDMAKAIVAKMYAGKRSFDSFACIAETRAMVSAVNIATVKAVFNLSEEEFVRPNPHRPSEPFISVPLHVGMRIVAKDNIRESRKCSRTVAKSEFGTITKVGVLKSEITLDRGNKVVKLNTKLINDCFAVGYCATVHSYQGSEADEVVYILENSANMRGGAFYSQKELKYVGLSRAKQKLDIMAIERGTTGVSKVSSIKVLVTDSTPATMCF